MSDESKEKKHYELEADDEPEVETQDPAAPTAKPREELTPDPDSIKALDVCPNCGSSLGDIGTVVCLRCGFDLKSLKVIKTETGGETPAEPAASEPDDQDGQEEAEPLSAPGNGDLWLPAAMAIASLVLLTLGFFWGSRGLISVDAEATVTIGARLEGMLRMLIRTGVVSVCGVGALYTLAYLRSTRLGDLQMAAVRMLGIVSAVSLLTFYHVDAKALEWAVEMVTQAAAFVGLSMVLFRLSARNAATLLGITVCAAIGLLIASAIVLWSAPPS